MVRNSYWGEYKARELAKECMGPDLNKEKAAISAPEQQDILDYVHRTKFFSENFFELQTTLNSIRDHQLRQNSGFNREGEKLLDEYFTTETFLHENSIVFDRYNEFHALTDQYIEGVLASYCCDDSLVGKITILGDDHLIPIILYGKPDEINNHFERYKITSLKYQPDTPGSTVYTLVCNLLNQYVPINEKFAGFIKVEIPEFFDYYIRRLSNSLLVLSVLDMERELLDDVARKLLGFLIVQTHVPHGFFSKWARLFLLRNEKKLSSSVWQEYFLSILKYKSLHEGYNISLTAHVFERRQLSLQITAEEFDQVIQNFIGKCRLCNDEHTWHDLSDIYRSLQDQMQKSRIDEMIMASFAQNLDPEKYCLAVVSNIIQSDEAMMQQCIDNLVALIERTMIPRLSNRRAYFTSGKLDQFINMCWKLDLDVPEPIKRMLPQLGIYYTWLSDLEGFDYSSFNPEWLTHSFTKYYKRRFRKSDALRNHLLEGILADRYDDYSKLFVRIYGKDD